MDQKAILDVLTNDFNKKKITQNDGQERIRLVNLMPKKNATKHNTGKFHLVKMLFTPIFRRGEEFTVTIQFNEQFVVGDNNLRLDFSFGANPNPDAGSMIRLRSPMSMEKDWYMNIISEQGGAVTVGVTPSPKCPVGIWYLTVVTQPGKQAYNVQQHMYILFNPWCIKDEVYMEKDNWRSEYVLNDAGTVYKNAQIEFHWFFDQFGYAALTAALYLLEIKNPINRGSPKEVCQKICDLDGQYILEGRWSGGFEGGISPMSWQASDQILLRFMKTKVRVKFGQCWCFAGIRTSLFRAIGIPCRPSTIYCCGSDNDRDGILEEIFRPEGQPLKTDDKVWNFHVWNDVWMSRPDLSPEYGGWQAADQFMLASLIAIKRGDVHLEYGTVSAFGDVNGVHVKTSQMEDGSKFVNYINKHNIGHLILTKAADAFKKQDITLEYKFREGSKDESDALNKALKTLNSLDKLAELERQLTGTKDVSFEVKVIKKNIAIGESVNISVEGENLSAKDLRIKFHLIGKATDYRGYDSEKVYEERFEEDFAPDAPFKITKTWKPDADLLGDFGYVRISATAKVVGTKEILRKEITINVTTPKLEFDVPNDMRVNVKSKIYVKFTNPLEKELTECSMLFDRSGSYEDQDDDTSYRLNRTVPPNGNFKELYEFLPEEAGHYVIAATFNSKELKDVMGTQRVLVV